jgi:hypothetical protein
MLNQTVKVMETIPVTIINEDVPVGLTYKQQLALWSDPRSCMLCHAIRRQYGYRDVLSGPDTSNIGFSQYQNNPRFGLDQFFKLIAKAERGEKVEFTVMLTQF